MEKQVAYLLAGYFKAAWDGNRFAGYYESMMVMKWWKSKNQRD